MLLPPRPARYRGYQVAKGELYTATWRDIYDALREACKEPSEGLDTRDASQILYRHELATHLWQALKN